MLAAQFRPYLGLVGVLSARVDRVCAGQNPWRTTLYAVTALAFVVGTLAFPVYRAALGIGFFLPNVSALMVTHVAYVTWDLDKETAQSLDTVVLNDEIRARLIGKDPISYGDAKHIFDDLVSSGQSPRRGAENNSVRSVARADVFDRDHRAATAAPAGVGSDSSMRPYAANPTASSRAT